VRVYKQLEKIMKKETATPVIPASQRRVIVQSFVAAMDARDNTGGIVTQVCNAARSICRGKPIGKEDQTAIVEDLADARGWKPDVLRARSSEVRVILDTYSELPTAIQHAQRTGTCNWHFALKVARLIRKGKPATAAVSAARKKSTADAVPVEGRIASLLKKLIAEKPRKRDAAMKAAHALNIVLA
jgi:hypothetical protein